MTTGQITEIQKTEIDWEDFYFRFGKKDKREDLAGSINQYGILETPIVFKREEKYRIFSGFNRLEVSKKKQNRFSVIIINEVTEDLLKREVGKKQYHGRIGISGKIKLCEIYRDFFNKDTETLKRIGKVIGGIPTDFFPGTENFSKLVCLRGEFRDYLDERDVSFKVIRNFLTLSTFSQDILVSLLIQWNSGKNNFKKLVEIIVDIEQLGDNDCFRDYLEGGPLKRKEVSFDEFYAGLSAMRYPSYTRMTAEKDRLLKLLNISSIRFIVPEFFEGDEIFLQAVLKRSEKPEDVLNKINELDKDLIVRLLQLL